MIASPCSVVDAQTLDTYMYYYSDVGFARALLERGF